MVSRSWLRPALLLMLFAAGCNDMWSAAKGLSRTSRKDRRAKLARQAEADANAQVKSDEKVEIRGETPEGIPNILLISLDTMRADSLPPYGGLPDNAPTLTAMAREGVYFENSYAQAPSTSPTHASLFTGALPSEHGLMGTTGRLPLTWWTLAEHMQAYGIRTWAAASSVRFALGVQLNQGFDEYAVFSRGSQTGKSDRATEVALAAIAAQPDRPWFGFIHLMDVHAPYDVPEPHQSKYLSGPPSVDPKDTVKFLHKYRSDKEGVSAKQLSDLKAMYAGGVSHVDTRIAQILDAVKKLERPTLIVVTADHGEAFFEKGYLGHGYFVHEPIMRVPLIFWGPGVVPEGEKRSTLAQSVDVFPTLVSVAKLPPPPQTRGLDLLPVIRGEGEVKGRSVYSQSRKAQMLVRDTEDGLWKLVLNGKGRKPRVYALHTDPLEQENVSRQKSELREAWTEDLLAVSFRALKGKSGSSAETWEMTDEERQALEAIGYMDVDH